MTKIIKEFLYPLPIIHIHNIRKMSILVHLAEAITIH